ncbi:MAG: methyltransferase [Frankiales bacterium]|nr:methyltransferase [Frankiales bacterium]
MTRVIAGEARGRRLRVPDGVGTRPTSDRAREGLFSSLQSLVDVEDALVLDLYAGSGALGLEALSRGARAVTLVEDEPAALAALRDNVAAVGLPGAEVVAARVEHHLAGPPRAYDIVLLDPPYEVDVDPVLAALLPWLSADAVLAVERRTRGPAPAWPEGVQAVRSRKYGEATLWYGSRS